MNPRTQTEIEEAIAKLQLELVESKTFYEWKLIEFPKKDMIGFFDIVKLIYLLEELHKGNTLKCRHSVYGDVDVKMNTQRNRMFCTGNGHMNETNILNYMCNYPSEWFIKCNNN